MKYCSENEKIHKLIDKELSETEKIKFEKHLSVCSECQNAFDSIHQTRALLIVQPSLLPSSNFNQKMLRLIENKTEKNEQKKGFLSIFSSLPLKLSFAALVAIVALGITFQLGRMSVSLLPQNVLTESLPAENESNPAQLSEKTTDLQPTEKIVTQVKTVIKYVQVPIIKKVKEEKIVYVNESKNRNMTVLSEQRNEAREKSLANEFNLKDLEPVSKVSYQIIRKGENNE